MIIHFFSNGKCFFLWEIADIHIKPNSGYRIVQDDYVSIDFPDGTCLFTNYFSLLKALEFFWFKESLYLYDSENKVIEKMRFWNFDDLITNAYELKK